MSHKGRWKEPCWEYDYRRKKTNSEQSQSREHSKTNRNTKMTVDKTPGQKIRQKMEQNGDRMDIQTRKRNRGRLRAKWRGDKEKTARIQRMAVAEDYQIWWIWWVYGIKVILNEQPRRMKIFLKTIKL